MKEDEFLPLSDVRIIDLSKLLPGPWCTQVLADMGAEIVKIESPAGDPSRLNPPLVGSESIYFCGVNGGKQSVVLDLKTEADRKALYELISEADVVIESFGKGGAAKLGIDYAKAAEINPAIIYCSITGFGQHGPLSGIAGHDLAIQATTGQLSLGEGGMPPFQAGDYSAACMATISILGALRKRDRCADGQWKGCFLDVSMYDALMGMSNIALTSALARLSGRSGTPAIEVWGKNPRYRLYPTRDGGHVAVCLLEAKIWSVFCRQIGRQDLIAENENPSARLTGHGERAGVYERVLADYFGSRDRLEVARELNGLHLPVMAVLNPDEAVASEHAVAREVVIPVEHPSAGRVFVLRGTPPGRGIYKATREPSPKLGMKPTA